MCPLISLPAPGATMELMYNPTIWLFLTLISVMITTIIHRSPSMQQKFFVPPMIDTSIFLLSPWMLISAMFHEIMEGHHLAYCGKQVFILYQEAESTSTAMYHTWIIWSATLTTFDAIMTRCFTKIFMVVTVSPSVTFLHIQKTWVLVSNCIVNYGTYLMLLLRRIVPQTTGPSPWYCSLRHKSRNTTMKSPEDLHCSCGPGPRPGPPTVSKEYLHGPGAASCTLPRYQRGRGPQHLCFDVRDNYNTLLHMFCQESTLHFQ